MTPEQLQELQRRAAEEELKLKSEPAYGAYETLSGVFGGGEEQAPPPEIAPEPERDSFLQKVLDPLRHLRAREEQFSGRILTSPSMVGLAELFGAGEPLAQRGQEMIEAGQQTRADIAARDVGREERLAEILKKPSPTAAAPLPKGKTSYTQPTKVASVSQPPTATQTSPETSALSAVRLDDGRIVFTNQPGKFEGENLDYLAAQSLLLEKETPENQAGAFRVRPGEGTMSGGGPLPQVGNLDPAAYEKLLNESSPLMQELLQERRAQAVQDQAEQLGIGRGRAELELAKKKMDPRFAASMELASQDEIQRRAGVPPESLQKELRFMADSAIRAWQKQNPNASPEELEGQRAAILGGILRKMFPELLPEERTARAKYGAF